MTYTLFGTTDSSGRPVAQVQQGVYYADFDFAPGGSGTSLSFTHHLYDEILDLTDPTQPEVPGSGVYLYSAVFGWNEQEAGASILMGVYLSVVSFESVSDLGVAPPTGPRSELTISGGNYADAGAVLGAYLCHDRASSNLTGNVFLSVVRIY